jgi:hypothetical protein
MSCTGYAAEYLPPGPERDECLGLIRIGVKFASQHNGSKPGYMHRYLLGLVGGMEGDLSFDRLLLELRFEARKRDLLGDDRSPIERVDESFEVLVWHDPRRGRRQMPFGTLRNAWTVVRKKVLG